jgi:hypothetical protein
VEGTKDGGQQAIIGTAAPVDPPPPAGGEAADLSRVNWRHVPLIAAVLWAVFLLWDGGVHALFLPFSNTNDEPWSWPRAILKSGLKVAICLAIAICAHWRRRR